MLKKIGVRVYTLLQVGVPYLPLRDCENIPAQSLCILTFLSHGAHFEAPLSACAVAQ